MVQQGNQASHNESTTIWTHPMTIWRSAATWTRHMAIWQLTTNGPGLKGGATATQGILDARLSDTIGHNTSDLRQGTHSGSAHGDMAQH